MGKMQRFGRRALGLLLGGVLTLMIGSGVLAADAAYIGSFTASSTMIQSGETVQLNWNVTGASKVEIVGIEKSDEILPLKGSLEVWPMVTTSYVLIATGMDGIVTSKSLTVNVDSKGEVLIKEFKASATKIQSGETVMLSWNVVNGVSVKVIGINRNTEWSLPTVGSTEVWPEETTTYLLQATGKNGEVASASISVNVVTAVVVSPKILTFKASQTEVSRGDLVTLSWTTENAVSCTIETSDGAKLKNRKPNGSISLTPNKTKKYTLIAYAADGSKTTSELTITVK